MCRQHEVGQRRHGAGQVRRQVVPERVGAEVVLEGEHAPRTRSRACVGLRDAPGLVATACMKRGLSGGDALRRACARPRRDRDVVDDDAVPDRRGNPCRRSSSCARRRAGVVHRHRVGALRGRSASVVTVPFASSSDWMPCGSVHLTGWPAPIRWSSARPSTFTLTVSRGRWPRPGLGRQRRRRPASEPPVGLPTSRSWSENCQWSIRNVFERRRLPVHRLRRGHLEHRGALLRPVQRRVGLVPHVVHADVRAVVRERVPRLPAAGTRSWSPPGRCRRRARRARRRRSGRPPGRRPRAAGRCARRSRPA